MTFAPALSGAPAVAGLQFLFELALKGTLVLALAALLVLAMRGASSAHRHLVWACALGGLLALPWMQLSLPAWKVSTPALDWIAPGFGLLAAAVEPRAELAPAGPSTSNPSVPSQASQQADAQGRAAPSSPVALQPPGSGGTWTPPPAAAAKSGNAKSGEGGGTTSPSTGVAGSDGSSATPAPSGIPFAGLVLLLWAVGALAVLSMFIAGHLVLRLMMHGARPVRDGDWHALALEAADRLGLTLPFSLLRAEGILVPVATGLVRPRVLLPEGCDTWPVELRRAVLLHELAHVQRHDCLTQAVAQVACALFWFHPGAWWAASRLQVERERACDDRVLAARTRASDYADHLLGMVRALRARRLAALGAVAFARPSSLEGRLLAVLDPRRDRRAVGRRVAVPAAIAAALLVLPFAALEPVAAGSATGGGKHSTSREPSDPGEYRPSRVVSVPDPGRTLEERVAWARADAGRSSARVWWVGWQFETSPTLTGNLLSDSEGISLSQLGRRGAFTLEDVLAGRSQGTSDPQRSAAHDEHVPACMLVRMNAGTPDRVRVQTAALPADFRREPLYWIDAVADDQAFAWLRDAAERSREPRLRARFVESIGFIQRTELVSPWLTATFKSAAPEEVRIGAAEGLSRHPSPEGVRLLTEAAYSDRSPEVRRASVEALGQFRTPEALQALLVIAGESGSDGTRRAAFDALGEQVSEREPDAEATSGKPSASSSSSKAGTPGSSSKAGVASKPSTASGAAKPDQSGKASKPDKSSKSAKSLPGDKAGAEDLTPQDFGYTDAGEPSTAMNRVDFDVQRQAIESLGRYPEAQSLPRLRKIAETSPHSELRAQAVESIGRLGTPAALALLEEIVWKNTDDRARDMAVESMGRRFPPDQALDKLARIAGTHTSTETRRAAVEMIGRVDSPRASDMLGKIVAEGTDPEARRQAVESLGRQPGDGVEAQLLQIARSQGPVEVRRQAVESLARRPGAGISNQLAEIARTHPSVEVRREAVESLGRRDDPAVPKLLLKLARDDGPEEVQRQAVESLGRHPDAQTRELLVGLAQTHRSVEIQRQAVESLGRLDDEVGGDVMGDLAKIARTHPSGEVRRQAVESMTRRDPDKALPLLEEILRQQK